jgi:drug/metabolite transporter (DMT)-like permease
VIVTLSKSYIVDLLLISIVVIWGFNFAVMKLMYRYFHPIAFNAIRFVIASLTMLGILSCAVKARESSVRICVGSYGWAFWEIRYTHSSLC